MPKSASVVVLLCLKKFFVKMEIVEFGFKLPVGFEFKLLVRFGFKLFVRFEFKLPVRFVFKVLVGFEFKFSTYIYSSYGCVLFCGEKIREI